MSNSSRSPEQTTPREAKPRQVLTAAELTRIWKRVNAGEYVPRAMLRRIIQTARVYEFQRLALAKLSAETPQFNSPVDAWEAQALRDEVLSAVSTPSSEPR